MRVTGDIPTQLFKPQMSRSRPKWVGQFSKSGALMGEHGERPAPPKQKRGAVFMSHVSNVVLWGATPPPIIKIANDAALLKPDLLKPHCRAYSFVNWKMAIPTGSEGMNDLDPLYSLEHIRVNFFWGVLNGLERSDERVVRSADGRFVSSYLGSFHRWFVPTYVPLKFCSCALWVNR